MAFGPLSGVLQAPDFYLVQGDSVRGFSPVETLQPQVMADLTVETGAQGSGREGIIEYVTRQGDTLSGLAAEFGISEETILWANNLDKSSVLAAGKTLVILPVSGVSHVVKAGETLSQIVQRYRANLENTLRYNALDNENEVFVGDIIIVPDGKMPLPVAQKPIPSYAPVKSGYFIAPLPAGYRRTQGLHWYNAVDLTRGQCGDPIYAAADGIVQKVMLTTSTLRSAFGGAGNHLTLLHPNGVVTSYGHLLGALVTAGQNVTQGQVIAYVGGEPGTPGAGRSTGCHVHFQVMGAANPFAY